MGSINMSSDILMLMQEQRIKINLPKRVIKKEVDLYHMESEVRKCKNI